MLSLLVLCEACSVLTSDNPCPPGTTERDRNPRIVACADNDDSRRETRVTFAETGKIESYVELVDGIPAGTSERFSPDGDVLESGQYRNGLRSGDWEEWTGDHLARGTYSKGMRVGRWELVPRRDLAKADFAVGFDKGVAVAAERAEESFQVPMAIADGASLAVALVGVATDRPALTIAGSAGFIAAGPLVHAWQQRPGERRSAALDSLGRRGEVLAATFGLYTIGKVINGFDCVDDNEGSEDGVDIGCDDTRFHFNRNYNWSALLITTAALVVIVDMDAAHRSTTSSIADAWPQLSIEPTQGGATVSLGGSL